MKNMEILIVQISRVKNTSKLAYFSEGQTPGEARKTATKRPSAQEDQAPGDPESRRTRAKEEQPPGGPKPRRSKRPGGAARRTSRKEAQSPRGPTATTIG